MVRTSILIKYIAKKSKEPLCQGMIDLGILKGNLKECIKEKAQRKYYPHDIGHWMGLDVYDACPYKKSNGKEIPLQPSIVMTIGLGIYPDMMDENIPKNTEVWVWVYK